MAAVGSIDTLLSDETKKSINGAVANSAVDNARILHSNTISLIFNVGLFITSYRGRLSYILLCIITSSYAFQFSFEFSVIFDFSLWHIYPRVEVLYAIFLMVLTILLCYFICFAFMYFMGLSLLLIADTDKLYHYTCFITSISYSIIPTSLIFSTPSHIYESLSLDMTLPFFVLYFFPYFSLILSFIGILLTIIYFLILLCRNFIKFQTKIATSIYKIFSKSKIDNNPFQLYSLIIIGVLLSSAFTLSIIYVFLEILSHLFRLLESASNFFVQKAIDNSNNLTNWWEKWTATSTIK